MPPCVSETQELPELRAVWGSPALWETLSNTFTPSLPDPVSTNFPLHPVLPLLSRLPPSHLPTKDLDLLWGSFQIITFCSPLTLITMDFHNIKNINGANCTRAQSFTRWNPQRLDISFRLRAGSRPWLLGSQMPLESWDAAWVTALFWLVDRLQPLKVYHALLFLAKGEDPYSTVQQEDIEPPFLAFLAVTHLRWHWD